MSLLLYHHPWSRAATVVWMLEEVGEPYALEFVDLRAGAHRTDAHRARNRMAKLPVLRDGDAIISETAAIGMYLADRYAPRRLAPALDSPDRGQYLRWCVFASAVVEPACMAKASKWEYSPSSAGFGTYDSMVETLEEATADGPWLLGDTFTMADVVLGATVRWMLQFGMLDRGEHIGNYADRLGERPAAIRAAEKNAEVTEREGLSRG